MKKILIVFGTRPEAIKMAPIIKEFQKNTDLFEIRICVTGQHKEMLLQVLKVFDIVPDVDLQIMKPNQDLIDINSLIMSKLKVEVLKYNPDLMLVHGDTTTAFASALTGFYLNVKIGHIEAGLRTYNLKSPWPEELNRQFTDKISDLHFAPTLLSKENLINENIKSENIHTVGNTVIDALIFAKDKINYNSAIRDNIELQLKTFGYSLSSRKNQKKILVTGHRRENFGDGFKNICEAIKKIAIKNPDVDIIYPVHLNPKVQEPVYKILADVENVFLIKPLDYLPFIYLMQQSYFILTDSGGIQEEAPSLGKPVLVMRDTSERPEAIEAGTVKLVGTCTDNIVIECEELLTNGEKYLCMQNAKNPYGDGKSAFEIVQVIKSYFKI